MINTSINLRVCREISGIANAMASLRGSVLIIGSPGTGKTTVPAGGIPTNLRK